MGSFTMFQRPKTGFSNANVAGVWNLSGFSSGNGDFGRAETGAIGRIILDAHAVITEVWNGHAKTIKAFADQGGPITGPAAPFIWTFTRLDYAGAEYEYDYEEAEY